MSPLIHERDELLNAVEELLRCVAALRIGRSDLAQRYFRAAADRMRNLYHDAPPPRPKYPPVDWD